MPVPSSGSIALAAAPSPASSAVTPRRARAACRGEALTGFVTNAPTPALPARDRPRPRAGRARTRSPRARRATVVQRAPRSSPSARHQHVEHGDVEGAVAQRPSASPPSAASTTSIPQAPAAPSSSAGSSRCRPPPAPDVRERPVPTERVGVMSVAPASNVTWNALPSPGTPSLSTHRCRPSAPRAAG